MPYVIRVREAPRRYLGPQWKLVDDLEKARLFTAARHAKAALAFNDWATCNMVKDGIKSVAIVKVSIEEESIPYPIPVDLA